MQNVPTLLARWLHTVALALWLGGLIAIGAFVAPTAFHIVRLNPSFANHPILQAQIAGSIVGDSLRQFNGLCYVCGILLIVTNALLWPGLHRSHRLWAAVSMGVSAVLLCTALYQGFSLFPTMDAAQSQGNTVLFDALHATYERLSIDLQFPLLLALALLAALRDHVNIPPRTPMEPLSHAGVPGT